MSSSELDTLQKAFRAAGGHWSTFVIWAKNTFTLGRSDYQRQYEPILYGWKDGADHYWCGARDQGDVWFIDKPAKNDLHPTMKPLELVERAIRNSSKSRDIVLDPFGGSGTTLIAAERSGRRARLVELDPKYVDVIVQRWENLTKVKATHAHNGNSFGSQPGVELIESLLQCPLGSEANGFLLDDVETTRWVPQARSEPIFNSAAIVSALLPGSSAAVGVRSVTFHSQINPVSSKAILTVPPN